MSKRLAITTDGAVIYDPKNPPGDLSLLERWEKSKEPLGAIELTKVPDWAYTFTYQPLDQFYKELSWMNNPKHYRCGAIPFLP